MTDDPSKKAGTDDARLLLRQGERALRDLLIAFDLLSDRIMDGDLPKTSDLAMVCATHAKVRTSLLEEIQKHERRVVISEGLTNDAPLDLDTLRHEIGRKIDRVREREAKE